VIPVVMVFAFFWSRKRKSALRANQLFADIGAEAEADRFADTDISKRPRHKNKDGDATPCYSPSGKVLTALTLAGRPLPHKSDFEVLLTLNADAASLLADDVAFYRFVRNAMKNERKTMTAKFLKKLCDAGTLANGFVYVAFSNRGQGLGLFAGKSFAVGATITECKCTPMLSHVCMLLGNSIVLFWQMVEARGPTRTCARCPRTPCHTRAAFRIPRWRGTESSGRLPLIALALTLLPNSSVQLPSARGCCLGTLIPQRVVLVSFLHDFDDRSCSLWGHKIVRFGLAVLPVQSPAKCLPC
jgi:hypothetical protein